MDRAPRVRVRSGPAADVLNAQPSQAMKRAQGRGLGEEYRACMMTHLPGRTAWAHPRLELLEVHTDYGSLFTPRWGHRVARSRSPGILIPDTLQNMKG